MHRSTTNYKLAAARSCLILHSKLTSLCIRTTSCATPQAVFFSLLAAADRLRWEILAASWAPSAALERRTAKASADPQQTPMQPAHICSSRKTHFCAPAVGNRCLGGEGGAKATDNSRLAPGKATERLVLHASINYKLQISRCMIMFDHSLETHQLVHPHNTLCYHKTPKKKRPGGKGTP